MLVEYVGVAVGAAVVGGWMVPVGIAIGLSPMSVLVAAYLGAMTTTILVVMTGGRSRDWLMDRVGSDAERRIMNGRARRVLDRWGVFGLASFGLIVLGPTVTVLAVLILGVDRPRFLGWAAVSTLIFYAVLTVAWAALL